MLISWSVRFKNHIFGKETVTNLKIKVMKKLERITRKIEADKETFKGIENVTRYEVERFIQDAQAYIKAIKDKRMVNAIGSVSASGMSRTLKFMSCEKNKYNSDFYYRNYFAFFKALDFSEDRKAHGYFRIGGAGMDMIFHTNYTIIHKLSGLGFISKRECADLAQDTPTTI